MVGFRDDERYDFFLFIVSAHDGAAICLEPPYLDLVCEEYFGRAKEEAFNRYCFLSGIPKEGNKEGGVWCKWLMID